MSGRVCAVLLLLAALGVTVGVAILESDARLVSENTKLHAALRLCLAEAK